jgi:hypothetical protein
MPIFLKTIAVIKDHKFPQHIVDKVREILQTQEGKKVTITLESEKKHRSHPQNSYYWGVVLPLMYSAFRDDWGNDVTKEDVHQYLKEHVGKLTKEIVDANGESRTVLRSSSSLSTMEFEEWMERIRAFAAPFNIQVPLPGELIYQERSSYVPADSKSTNSPETIEI